MARSILYQTAVVTSIGVIALILVGCKKPHSTLSPADTLADAWRNLRTGDQDISHAEFQDVIDRSAGPAQGLLRLQAKYGLASLYALGSEPDIDKSREFYEQVIAEDTGGKLAPWAALGMVREDHLSANLEENGSEEKSERDKIAIDRQRIADAYTRVIEKYPGTPATDEALVYLEALRLSWLDPVDVTRVQTDTEKAADQGGSRFESSLYSLQQTAAVLSADYPAELTAAVRAIDTRETDPANPAGLDPAAIYTAGVIAQFDVGDFPTARRLYSRFLTQAPKDLRGFTARLLIADMDRLEAGKPSGIIVDPPKTGGVR